MEMVKYKEVFFKFIYLFIYLFIYFFICLYKIYN